MQKSATETDQLRSDELLSNNTIGVVGFGRNKLKHREARRTR